MWGRHNYNRYNCEVGQVLTLKASSFLFFSVFTSFWLVWWLWLYLIALASLLEISVIVLLSVTYSLYPPYRYPFLWSITLYIYRVSITLFTFTSVFSQASLLSRSEIYIWHQSPHTCWCSSPQFTTFSGMPTWLWKILLFKLVLGSHSQQWATASPTLTFQCFCKAPYSCINDPVEEEEEIDAISILCCELWSSSGAGVWFFFF